MIFLHRIPQSLEQATIKDYPGKQIGCRSKPDLICAKTFGLTTILIINLACAMQVECRLLCSSAVKSIAFLTSWHLTRLIAQLGNDGVRDWSTRTFFSPRLLVHNAHRSGRPLRINFMSRYICFSQIGPFDVSFEELFSKVQNPGGFFRKIVF